MPDAFIPLYENGQPAYRAAKPGELCRVPGHQRFYTALDTDDERLVQIYVVVDADKRRAAERALCETAAAVLRVFADQLTCESVELFKALAAARAAGIGGGE